MPFLLAVMGPTACGKSDLAETLADRSKVELINADAFQAYRGMDIGTAKPIAKERYRLLDIKDPNEPYGVGEFCMRAQEELDDL
ncbi:MAG TPA: isopentenyl transferase family protein, partial [Fimbriimonas sp.]|nr:isopentenyl transferase family protein [Fimbriimonas sp.]